MKFLIAVVGCIVLFPCASWGIISSPGLGPTNSASWLALGIKQDLDNKHQVQSLTYAGMGRISNTVATNPLNQPAILVFTEEVYHQFSPFWKYSLAVSYRRQNEYVDGAPFLNSDPAIKQEFRGYGRYSFVLPLGSLKWSLTLRQEFRRFLAPNFTNLEDLYQLRSRFKTQLAWQLDRQNTHRITAQVEILLSTNRQLGDGWSPFEYRESRMGLYYSYFPKSRAVAYTIGYMNNLVTNHSESFDAHYVSCDVVLLNPF